MAYRVKLHPQEVTKANLVFPLPYQLPYQDAPMYSAMHYESGLMTQWLYRLIKPIQVQIVWVAAFMVEHSGLLGTRYA